MQVYFNGSILCTNGSVGIRRNFCGSDIWCACYEVSPILLCSILAPIIAIVLAMVGVAMPKTDETSMKEDKETVKEEEKGEVLC